MSYFRVVHAELRRIGIVIRRESGEYRVNFRGGPEETAYYTDDLEDALGTGRAMAEHKHRAERIRVCDYQEL